MLSRINAAIIFFTRLPLWRVATPAAECYKRVVALWPLAGWITGGATALTIWAASYVLAPAVAVTLAMAVRALLTGCLHEDGLADWWDAFGAGGDRERVLAIMKDSHIGTYGVVALLLYYTLTIVALSSLPVGVACAVALGADVWSKCCASRIINRLPYARTEQTAKNRTVYDAMTLPERAANLLIGASGLLFLPAPLLPAIAGPVIVAAVAIRAMRRAIGGYTGDCCGATALMAELSFTLIAAALFTLFCPAVSY